MAKPNTIAVMAMSMSRRSGGIMSVYDGLMRSAAYSENRFVFVTSEQSTDIYPDNVTVIPRPKLNRFVSQILVSLPGVRPFLGAQSISRILVTLACGTKLPRADSFLWSHCFAPVPNLGNTMTVQADMIHKYYPELFSRRQLAVRSAGERSLKNCKAVLSISQSSADDLLEFYPEYADKTHVFHLSGVEMPPKAS